MVYSSKITNDGTIYRVWAEFRKTIKRCPWGWQPNLSLKGEGGSGAQKSYHVQLGGEKSRKHISNLTVLLFSCLLNWELGGKGVPDTAGEKVKINSDWKSKNLPGYLAGRKSRNG